MKRIVLLRHGESLWNKENRFTGWTDVDLSDKGIAEACKAGDMLKEAGFSFEALHILSETGCENVELCSGPSQ